MPPKVTFGSPAQPLKHLFSVSFPAQGARRVRQTRVRPIAPIAGIIDKGDQAAVIDRRGAHQPKQIDGSPRGRRRGVRRLKVAFEGKKFVHLLQSIGRRQLRKTIYG